MKTKTPRPNKNCFDTKAKIYILLNFMLINFLSCSANANAKFIFLSFCPWKKRSPSKVGYLRNFEDFFSTTPCWSVLDFELDFYCLCSVWPAKIDFENWFLQAKNPVCRTWFFKNKVQINKGLAWLPKRWPISDRNRNFRGYPRPLS